MPHNTGSSFIYSFLFYLLLKDAVATLDFWCANHRIISFALECDGKDDCGDNSDEQNCDYTASPHLLPFHCLYTNITYTCKFTPTCIPQEKFCDSVVDCPDGTDEYLGCTHDLQCFDNKYKCKDGHCIRKSWVCDGTKDCPDGSDESSCDNLPRSESDCVPANNAYLCKNKRCVSLDDVCNNADDCGDLSDENGNCTELCKNCRHKCHKTPAGSVCICEAGFKLANETSCEDINECETFGICDQLCENTRGSYKCSCKENYNLQNDGKTCRAAGHAEATLYFTDFMQIRGIFLESEIHILEHEIIHHSVTSMTANGDNIYWSSKRNIYVVDLRTGRHDVAIVTVGPKNIQEMAVDWITGNLYFADWNHFIAVCTHNASHCVQILNTMSKGHPIAFALSPPNGVMFVGCTIEKLGVSFIEKADMDGANAKMFVTSDVGYPAGITVDHGTDRVYWTDSKLLKIESIRLDGTDRRVLKSNLMSIPISISVFENYVYWSNNASTDIEYSNKFTAKDWKVLYHADTILRHLYISHSAARPMTNNPCDQHSCPELCLLNSNKSYTCACTSNKHLVNNTCLESKEVDTLIVSLKGFYVHYYKGFIGMEKKVHVNEVSFISEMTCDPITGDIIAYDVFLTRLVRYKPLTYGGEITTMMHSEFVQGMAIDHIGNNLITSVGQSIEMYSMTTEKKIVFDFSNMPTSVAVVPERGIMFAAFVEVNSNCYVDRIPMNNIKAQKRFILKSFSYPRTSLFYDRYTTRLFVGDYLSGSISSYSIEEYPHTNSDAHFDIGYKTLISIAVTKDEVYWTEENSDELYWKSKSDIMGITKNNTDVKNVAFILPVRVHFPILTVQYHLQIPKDISKVGCRDNNGNCSHVCLPTSINTYICACPPEMSLSANNRTCHTSSECPEGEVSCNMPVNKCIKHEQWCDGFWHCPHGEDEMQCKGSSNTCAHNQFKCKNGECVSLNSRCDSHEDCRDKSDEENCAEQCNHNQFRCNDGKCIPQQHVCNTWADCIDYSDEFDCGETTCHPSEFKCKSGQCVWKWWECDGERDCWDNSDEHENCTHMKECTAANKQFPCANGRCVSLLLKCNNIDDCGDNSDETQCADHSYIDNHPHVTCSFDEYQCDRTTTCIPHSLVCDGVRNCILGDDENHCSDDCFVEEFTCRNGECIDKEYVCDYEADCADGSDEENCYGSNSDNTTSKRECEEYTCPNGMCILFLHVCDHDLHCPDGSDESGECGNACTPLDNVICEQICHKTPSGGVCRCTKGYTLASDNRSCKDVNECNHHVCSQNCQNTPGSYECSCHEGYTLRSDSISCRALGPPMEYIFATYTDIRKLSIAFRNVDVLHEDTTVSQIDVNDADGNVYWTSEYQGTLNKLNVTTKNIFTMNGLRPISLAVDSVTDNVYISTIDEIKVCKVEQRKCATLITKKEEEERIIKVIIDVHNRYLYWIVHKNTSEIVRSDMIGHNIKVIVRDTGIANSLAIDSTQSRLYWLRISQKIVESSDLDGQHRTTILHLQEPIFNMYIFENEIYSALNGYLTKCKLYSNKPCYSVSIPAINSGFQFVIQHSSKLPRNLSQLDGNPCEKLNCAFMCVLTAQPTCICEDGTPVEANMPCTVSREYGKAHTENQKGAIILSILSVTLVIGLLYYCYRKQLLRCWRRVRTDTATLSFRNLLYFHNADNPSLVEPINVITSSANTDESAGQSTTRKHVEFVNPMVGKASELHLRPAKTHATERTESMGSENEDPSETLINIE